MDEPNTLTLLSLIVLAEIIQIPIQSVYPGFSAQELHDNPNHAYKHLNQVFYPSSNQNQDNKTTLKPIIILWSHDQDRDMLCPVPLLAIDETVRRMISCSTVQRCPIINKLTLTTSGFLIFSSLVNLLVNLDLRIFLVIFIACEKMLY